LGYGQQLFQDEACRQGEASWNYHCVIPGDAVLGVPNKISLDSHYIAKNMVNVAVAVAARENNYPNSRCHITLQ
jgi:hypothetical protein